MTSHRWVARVAGLVVLTGCVSAARAEDTSAEELLKSKGLRRSGTTYVLEAESEVQKKLNEARLLYRQLSYAIAQQRQFEQGATDARAMIQGLTQQRMILNQQLSMAATVQQHNQIVGMMNQITDQLNLLRQGIADPDAKREINAQVPSRREAFVQAVIDLRQLVDETDARYKALADDAEVKDALEALNQKTLAKLTLGPSRSYQANVSLLERAEATVLTESVELRKEGGVFWLDVTFNGRVTRPMVFDTGASLTTLPAELADAIGLKPSPSDRTIQCQVADGSVVSAKLMKIPSVRVGKFTVKDVECAVMPAGKEDVPPLLGGSFHKFFTYKFSPESGKLVLTQVETPGTPAETPGPGRRGRLAPSAR